MIRKDPRVRRSLGALSFFGIILFGRWRVRFRRRRLGFGFGPAGLVRRNLKTQPGQSCGQLMRTIAFEKFSHFGPLHSVEAHQ